MKRSMAVVVAAVVVGCGGGTASTSTSPSSSADAARIAARVADYAIRLDRESAPRGIIAFDVRNDGRATHQFVILRSDRAAAALPRAGDEVVERAAGRVQAEAEGIGPGRTTTLRATLRPGRYVLLCNLRGHYARGMRAAFRVT
jgi:hypothetical protein